jgi:DNA-binding NtrC family response regulator
MQYAADHSPIIHTILAAHVHRQQRGDPCPLIVVQPKQVASHVPCPPPWQRITNRFTPQEIYWVLTLANVVDAAQRQHIQAVIDRSGGRLKKAAELLGISRTTLWEKMRRLGLTADNVDEDVRDS